MQNTVTVEEVKARLDELLDQARQSEEWTITRANGQPIAKLATLPTVHADALAANHASLIGLMKGQIEVAPDFDEPLDDFKPYME